MERPIRIAILMALVARVRNAMAEYFPTPECSWNVPRICPQTANRFVAVPLIVAILLLLAETPRITIFVPDLHLHVIGLVQIGNMHVVEPCCGTMLWNHVVEPCCGTNCGTIA